MTQQGINKPITGQPSLRHEHPDNAMTTLYKYGNQYGGTNGAMLTKTHDPDKSLINCHSFGWHE